MKLNTSFVPQPPPEPVFTLELTLPELIAIGHLFGEAIGNNGHTDQLYNNIHRTVENLTNKEVASNVFFDNVNGVTNKGFTYNPNAKQTIDEGVQKVLTHLVKFR